MLITPNLLLPYIDVNAAQREVVHNEAIRGLDALAQLAVLDRNLATPPGSPSDGERWIVAASPTGAWSGHAAEIAAWQDGAWRFYAPRPGWLAYVMDEDALVTWDGTAWVAVLADPTALQNMALLGVGTTADATNPLSAKLNNTLWVARTVAEGGDGNLRYKLSKESASNTLSFLFQKNFSGRAEIGLTGDDNLHLKVSPNGSAWNEVFVTDPSGSLGFGLNNVASINNAAFAALPKVVVAGNGIGSTVQVVRHTSPGAGGALVALSATRGANATSYTAVQANDGIGQLLFSGADGTRLVAAGGIQCQVDGAVSTDNVPGRLVFATSPGGANNQIERARIDSAGNHITKYGIADQSYAHQTPVTGFSITLSAAKFITILEPAGTLASGTITMPAAPIDGQRVRVVSTAAITALTVLANSGQSILNAPTTLAAGGAFEFLYRAANTTWYRAA